MIIPVQVKDSTYEVIVERGCIDKVIKYLDLNRKVLIITDSNIPLEYVENVKKNIKNSYVYTIKSGEESKNFTNFENILKFLIDNQFSRTDCIIALGGGVVGDLSGFVASVYMRGIDFYNIPTTLLSQVDSSIGGKTAIDMCGIKNIVGAFYPPKKVLIDPNVLKTLDERQVHSGLVEAYKMGFTFDKELVDLIMASSNLNDDIDEIIIRALNIKKDVVEKDFKEENLRKVLNFGHTVGHAIEASGKFNDLLHGECVGLGMLYMVSDELRETIKNFLVKYNLPYECNIDKEELFRYISLDKKRSNDYISVIRVEEIGKFLIEKISLEDVKNYL